MSYFQVVGLIAGVLSIVDFVLYDISIIRRRTTPNRATWFILTVIGILIFSSSYSLGARETLWVALGYILGPFFTSLLSIKFGEGGWTKFDKFCLFGAALSGFLWWQTGSALVALLSSIIIDIFGLLPTIKKSYFRPDSEEFFPWFVTVLACVLNVFAIQQWKFDIWIYPIYMLVINGLIAYLLYFRPKVQPR